MLWKGDHFKDLIDVVVCFEKYRIVKSPRNIHVQLDYSNRLSHHKKEHQMMRSLPIFIRNGFILAKAVRIASISKPDNLELFGLEETINADDVITSFILKAFFLGWKGYNLKFDKCKTSHHVAVMIYEQLITGLKENKVYSSYAREYPVDCTECDDNNGCCKQLKLMLAMVEKILDWLK